MDLTEVIPLVELEVKNFTVGHTTLKDASSNDKTCSYNQHAFIPFVFDTFGFLAP